MAYDIHDIEKNFKYHTPNSIQIIKYQGIRGVAKNLAELILEECPDSPEKTLAFRSLEQTVMWANASIARNE